MWKGGCCFLVVCLFAWNTPAQGQAAKPLKAVPDGFSFDGAWDCRGTFRAGAPHRAVFHGEVVVGGTWLELTEADVEPATGYIAKYLIGYDPQAKRLVEFDANNFGAVMYTSEDGWKERVLTMISPVTEDPKARYAVNRFLYTIAGPDGFTVDWQISKTATLNWVQADHLECKRKAAPTQHRGPSRTAGRTPS